MGKTADELESKQRAWDGTSSSSSGSSSSCRNFFCHGRFARHWNLKCLLVLILSLSIFLPALFLLVPSHSRDHGFDAAADTKAQAAVQAYFRLEKPVLLLIPYIKKLEDELSGEVGVPDAKIAVLSMHQSGSPDWTDVVFGVFPDPIDASINPMSLNVLKASLIDIFLLQSNLNLTHSIFGQPSSFQLLKFSGGITVIPVQSISLWEMQQMLFNFSLNNSISDINENLSELKLQLKGGLHLRYSEYAYIQVTNAFGSTTNPPVTVQATVLSDLEMLVPGRLKQLAQVIQSSSPSRNLGLNDTVFGAVNSITLSSYLKNTINADSPVPSPAPSPDSPVSPSSSSSDCEHKSSWSNCHVPADARYADSPSAKGLPCPSTSNPQEALTDSPTPSLSLVRIAPTFSPTQPSSSPSSYCLFKGIQMVSSSICLFHLLHLIR